MVDISYGEYASKWGLTDLYDESKAKLEALLESGEDFETDWCGCKKEIRYAKYTRDGENFIVEVVCHMDDLQDDLIYDAVWKVFGEEKALDNETMDEIYSAAYWGEISDSTHLSERINAEEATLEKVMEVTGKLEGEAEEENERMFDALCGIVEEIVG